MESEFDTHFTDIIMYFLIIPIFHWTSELKALCDRAMLLWTRLWKRSNFQRTTATRDRRPLRQTRGVETRH